jgi:hypothetical protein
MGSSDVKGERMGLSPLAVSELAKEFRRLAAEALERQRRLPRKFVKDRYEYLGMAHAYKDAARRLEEEI